MTLTVEINGKEDSSSPTRTYWKEQAIALAHAARAVGANPTVTFWKDIGADGLIVRGYHGHPFWHVERNGPPGRPHGYRNMTLVHIFGSTPVVTRTYQAATYLGEYCYHNDPPGGLRWVNECPDDIRGAIEFAEQRRVDEAIAATLHAR
jgi:hypothetical protein